MDDLFANQEKFKILLYKYEFKHIEKHCNSNVTLNIFSYCVKQQSSFSLVRSRAVLKMTTKKRIT